MNLRRYFTASFFLKAIFTLSLFILIFISSISYKHSLSLAESSDLVIHSYKVDVELEKMFSYLKDAETGQRGFLITHDSVFLKPYNTSRENVNNSFTQLKKLTNDNLQQQNNLDSLYQLINTRFSQLENSLTLSKLIPVNQSLLVANMRLGKDLMENVRNKINKMINLEMVYLTERQQKYQREISFTPLFTLLLLLFALLVFVVSYYKINMDLKIQKEVNEKLSIAAASIEHAEEIGDFCTWQWDLKTNKLFYSDNQYRLLGWEPNSFEPTIEKLLEFVHPIDRHIITEGGNQVLNHNKYQSAVFRINRKDGEVRYFKSLSKLLVDDKEKKILIGINIDVTEQHLNNIALEERNRELEHSNRELASFTHLASHDLQEPLRKIQTFISRISEKELQAMSASGMEYFSRIKASVTRMRLLIDDLLYFSRTNKTEKFFEKSDLNLLLENAKQDLLQAIEEKRAVIHAVHLPMLIVIPFQIQQLFANIIGNSLKYCKPKITPIIKIDCEIVIANEQPVLKTESDKKYYKISISDNGLGFEQQYAENIFILFNRLHRDGDYPGTGIGLSICKKITENHNGFIVAEGNLGVGATFTVFLPA